jgi:predicted secreted protein with PEFG-CTERM motif
MSKLEGFMLLAILFCAIGVAPVFASPYALQNSTVTTSTNATLGNPNPSLISTATSQSSGGITVTTDKSSYNDGDKIMISGSTQDFISGTPVTVRIISPIGNIVKVDQVDLGSDRTFSTSITATGTLWQAAGAYQVIVQFGSKERTAQTTFQFTGSAAAGGGGQVGNTIKVDGTDLSVKYSITNGKVLSIKADIQSKSLMVSIQTTGDGVLTVTLPRSLINATSHDGKDDQYFVLVDGQQVDFQETITTTTDRTLSIPFTDGTEEIEIIGTQIVPEFGPIAALVLAIAIISIIAVSAKTGLRIMPKY